MKLHTITLGLIVALLLSACGGATITPDTLPSIRYGEDVCDHCGMIISDERFAASVVVQTQPAVYEHRIFDDIGDMLAYAHEIEAPLEIITYYVHDYESREWLNAQKATFVLGDAAATPMGSGLVAFADHAAAVAFAENAHSKVLDFAALYAQPPSHHNHAAQH